MGELDQLNEFINREFGHLLPRQPKYRYWHDEKGNRYFYTTEPLIIEGKKRWTSGIYRHLKIKKQYILKSRVNHAKRKGAKERAYRLYQKRKQQTAHRAVA